MKMFRVRYRHWRLYFNPAARKFRREMEDWMNTEEVQEAVREKTKFLMTLGIVKITEKNLHNSPGSVVK